MCPAVSSVAGLMTSKYIRHGELDPFAVDIKLRSFLLIIHSNVFDAVSCRPRFPRRPGRYIPENITVNGASHNCIPALPGRHQLARRRAALFFCHDPWKGTRSEDLMRKPAQTIASSAAPPARRSRTSFERSSSAGVLLSVWPASSPVPRPCQSDLQRRFSPQCNERRAFSIFTDLGPSSTECHLDGKGALRAADA